MATRKGLTAWLNVQKRTYVGNATSVRDYRVQLRGSRSVLLFGLYLIVLIGVAMTIYNQSEGTAISIAEAQQKLHSFYETVMILLGVVVSLVTPALAATAVVTERQRRSLDLIFSAPVTPKYYLVGKALAGFRYTWMLLVLALPITAACVVLGGATWSDVLVSFTLLSFQGLVLMSIGLLISTLATKAVSAVVWTYVAVAAYLGLTGIASYTVFTNLLDHQPDNQTFLLDLSPFFVVSGAPTSTTIGTLVFPNWVAACLICLAATKILLLGAGTVLDPSNSKLVRSLRIHGLVYVTAIAGVAGISLARFWNDSPIYTGPVAVLLSMPLVIVVPHLTAYAREGARRHRPNGLCNFRRMLDGTPAGALPYLLSLVVLLSLSITAGAALTGAHIRWVESGSSFVYLLAFWTLMWSLGRATSAYLNDLKLARILQVVSFLALVVVPLPLLAVFAQYDNSDTGWYVWILRPMTAMQGENALPLAYAFACAVGAGLITWWSEVRLGKRFETLSTGTVDRGLVEQLPIPNHLNGSATSAKLEDAEIRLSSR